MAVAKLCWTITVQRKQQKENEKCLCCGFDSIDRAEMYMSEDKGILNSQQIKTSRSQNREAPN